MPPANPGPLHGIHLGAPVTMEEEFNDDHMDLDDLGKGEGKGKDVGKNVGQGKDMGKDVGKENVVPPPDLPNPAPAPYQCRQVVIEDWDSDNELEDIELHVIDTDNALVGSIKQDPKFIEHHKQLGLNADNAPEMDDRELWAYLQNNLGDIAVEEWRDIFNGDLTETDCKTLKFLAARLHSHFSQATYEDLRLHACKELGLSSDFVTWQRLKVLSGLESCLYDCCIESCICYLSKYEDYDACPYCKSPWYTCQPLPGRTIIVDMRHCADHETYRATNPGIISDIFDSEIYQTLQQTQVKPDNNYRYFSCCTDIALALGTDGFSMYKQRQRKGNSSAWLINVVNLNLHPSIRTCLENIICIGAIPGPKDCKDINSFLIPLVEELLELTNGIETHRVASEGEDFDGAKIRFTLHAFLIILFGDIPAISKLLKLRGPNAIMPCRMCLVPGTIYHGHGTTYYVPLTPPGDVEAANFCFVMT